MTKYLEEIQKVSNASLNLHLQDLFERSSSEARGRSKSRNEDIMVGRMDFLPYCCILLNFKKGLYEALLSTCVKEGYLHDQEKKALAEIKEISRNGKGDLEFPSLQSFQLKKGRYRIDLLNLEQYLRKIEFIIGETQFEDIIWYLYSAMQTMDINNMLVYEQQINERKNCFIDLTDEEREKLWNENYLAYFYTRNCYASGWAINTDLHIEYDSGDEDEDKGKDKDIGKEPFGNLAYNWKNSRDKQIWSDYGDFSEKTFETVIPIYEYYESPTWLNDTLSTFLFSQIGYTTSKEGVKGAKKSGEMEGSPLYILKNHSELYTKLFQAEIHTMLQALHKLSELPQDRKYHIPQEIILNILQKTYLCVYKAYLNSLLVILSRNKELGISRTSLREAVKIKQTNLWDILDIYSEKDFSVEQYNRIEEYLGDNLRVKKVFFE